MRGSDSYSQYEARIFRETASFNAKVAGDYREKYLRLRKVMREFSRETGVEFPSEINKLIGMK